MTDVPADVPSAGNPALARFTAWTARYAVPLLLVPVALYLLLSQFDPLARNSFIDLHNFVAAANLLLDGAPLYEGSPSGDLALQFNYPPFAAVLFIPLTLIPPTVLEICSIALTILLLAFVAHLSLRMMGAPAGRDLRLAALGLAGPLMWLEPVTWGLCVGQLNLLLLALVLWDLRTRDGAAPWYRGALVGVAAGIKLFPGIFIPYLLLTRQFRAALVAGAAFLATVAIGFAAAFRDSSAYWSGTFLTMSRYGSHLDRNDQSLNGMIARILGTEEPPLAPWLVVAVIVTVAGMWAAVYAHGQGRPLLGMTLCGLTASAVAPFTWSHHWVWFVPFALLVAGWGLRRAHPGATVVVICTILLLTAWPLGYLTGDRFGPILGTIALPIVRPLDVLYGNLYLWIHAVVLVVVFFGLRRQTGTADGVGERPRPGSEQRTAS